MGVRTYYLQSLAGEPFAFDLTSARQEFSKDIANWRERIVTNGIGKLRESVIMAVRTVFFDALAIIKAAFKLVCIHHVFDLPALKSFSFCAWNLAVADTALVLSVFTGVVLPSSRTFAESIHKGDIYLFLFEQNETARQVEDELAKQQ